MRHNTRLELRSTLTDWTGLALLGGLRFKFEIFNPKIHFLKFWYTENSNPNNLTTHTKQLNKCVWVFQIVDINCLKKIKRS